jgi:mRNA-degrading endonuclease RelE of RelBE toxin-antitoxin system
MEAKKFHVFVEPIANKKLAAHMEFLSRVSKNATIQLYKEYEEALRYLEGSPESCPSYLPRMSIDAQLRYKLFGKRYRIVFEIVDNAVYVYDIQDCRQDVDKSII